MESDNKCNGSMQNANKSINYQKDYDKYLSNTNQDLKIRVDQLEKALEDKDLMIK